MHTPTEQRTYPDLEGVSMSSFRVSTVIETQDSAGKKERKAYTASQTSLTDVVWKNIQVGADETIFVWDPTTWADYTPTNFATLAMISDGTLDIEMTINKADSAVEYNSFRLVANTPFILGADDAYYDHASTTDAAFGGTLDVIDAIRVDEPNNANVNLTIIMGV